jgi:predicted dehydrogenase
MSKAPLKIGLVGLGGIGNVHAESYQKDDLAELVAVCDVRPERVESFSEKFGAKGYPSVQEMLRNEELDIVDITTSGYDNGSWHYEPTMEALEAGHHVLCEKPLSNNIEECREMVRYAARKKLYLGCNLNHYFTQTSALAKQLIADDKIGETVYALFKMGFDGGEFTYGGKGSARFNQAYAHMKAFLTHPFSVMRHFCGDITHIQSFSTKPGFRKNKGDLLLSVNSVHVKFADDTVGYLLSQRGDAVWGLGGWWSFELAGSKGTFCIENCVEKLTYWGAPTSSGKPGPIVTNTGVTSFDQTFPDRIHAFLEDVSNKVPLEHVRASGRDALATMEYIFAVIESYENGGALVRPHPLPPLHGDPLSERI